MKIRWEIWITSQKENAALLIARSDPVFNFESYAAIG